MRSVSSSAGTPTTRAYVAFNKAQDAIRRNGAALAQITGGTLSFANGIEVVRTIRDDLRIEGADPGLARATGQVTSRFADTLLLDDASGNAAIELAFEYRISDARRLTVTLHEAYLALAKTPIQEPAGVQATFDLRAAYNATARQMMTVTLRNAVDSYGRSAFQHGEVREQHRKVLCRMQHSQDTWRFELRLVDDQIGEPLKDEEPKALRGELETHLPDRGMLADQLRGPIGRDAQPVGGDRILAGNPSDGFAQISQCLAGEARRGLRACRAQARFFAAAITVLSSASTSSAESVPSRSARALTSHSMATKRSRRSSASCISRSAWRITSLALANRPEATLASMNCTCCGVRLTFGTTYTP
jgi:hypothetical protein